MAGDPGGLLRRPAAATRDLDADHVDGAVHTSGQGLDEASVSIRFGPEAMMHVAHGEPEHELGAKQDEGVQEGDRVGAARDAYEDVLSRIDEPRAGHCLPHGGGQDCRSLAEL